MIRVTVGHKNYVLILSMLYLALSRTKVCLSVSFATSNKNTTTGDRTQPTRSTTL